MKRHPNSINEAYTLFFNTVRMTNKKDYSQEQIQEWAPQKMNPARWQEIWDQQTWFIQRDGDILTGFATLTKDGYLDLFFVHHMYQGQGIGRKLVAEAVAHAKAEGLQEIHTDASLTAHPIFKKMGFTGDEPKDITLTSQTLQNIPMVLVI